jgi:hypothetical protein
MAVEITNTQHGTDEWLKAREKVNPAQGGLTASVVPDVCYVGYVSIHKRLRYASGAEKQPEASAFAKQIMQHGVDNEEEAAQVLCELMGWPKLQDTGFWLNPDVDPLLGATPDKLRNGREPVEIKCPQNIETALPGTDKFTKFAIQLMVQMAILESKVGHLFVYGKCNGDDSFYVCFPWDYALWDAIQHYIKVYRDCLRRNVPPPKGTQEVKYRINSWTQYAAKKFCSKLTVK